MNSSRILNLLVVVAVLTVAGAGCAHKKPDKPVTVLNPNTAVPTQTKRSSPGDGIATSTNPDTATSTTTRPEVSPDGIPTVGGGELEKDFNLDPDAFKSNTVYFDYDQAAVKTKERVKIEEVATFLKSSSGASKKMLVEGHCDERGTEEYNRALGERRALAVREYLVRLGVAPDRVYTRSYGEDRPAVQGHDEAAWSKNRRGAFVVLTPK